jgi:cell division protein FtsL
VTASPIPVRSPRGGFHVVVAPGLRRRSRLRLLLLIAVVAVGAFFLLISSRIALDRTAFVREDLEAQIEAEEARYWELRLEVARLQSPERITSLATDMGLVYPDDVRTVSVPGLGEPGPGVEERWVDLKVLLSASP